ncbi:unnamed protein product [Cylindrotheca closterium]|uniref:DUF6824 domain-containing protein n=1 Tax=Cylindrotheca closterium TaxID=2856 RepID=A0AAD2CSV9_9STRA|nr:unnamed protein product [Cylindrotheca closterium]
MKEEDEGEAAATAVKTEAVEAMATTDSTVEAALQAAQIETGTLEAAASIANASAIPAVADPVLPTNRDVKLGDESHPGTMLLLDLILLHKVLLPPKENPDDRFQASDPEVQQLASKLLTLFKEGKQCELAGIKEVPRPFLVGKGRIFEKKGEEFIELKDDVARERLVEIIVDRFKTLDRLNSIQGKGAVDKEILGAFDLQFRSKKGTEEEGEGESSSKDGNGETKKATTQAAPRACDVLFLPIGLSSSDSAPTYDNQTGNKDLLALASQNVVVDTKEADMRVQIALKLLTSRNDDVNSDSGETVPPKTPRYLLQQVDATDSNDWKELEAVELAEFATIFVFEVYLEKQIHGTPMVASAPDTYKASTVPLEQPTVHDVLFGRGGMTNGHPGNRRFRDIIALHRPDYIRASKMDKPKVARRIVRAIRLGNPPGRFLKKGDDNKWYDVGDRCAAEKTSQGLRERSNSEKRQRSAMREALRIRRDDLDDGDEPSSKKVKTSGEDSDIPLTLNMKEKKSKTPKKAAVEGDASTSDLPPNAVDKEGNILVTDHDILCGRGGLTNHHKGNKRFRDIVALHRPDYVRAPKIQKPSVARVIVRAIRNGDPPGRFLRKDKKSGLWVDIGDKRAAEKTSQALREKTREEQAKAPGLSPFAEMEGAEADGPTPVLPLPDGEKVEGEAEEETKAEEGKTETEKARSEAAKSMAMVEI